MKRRSSILGLFLASTMLCGLTAGALAEDLVTADLVGKADAPNTLVFRTNPDFAQTSPTAGQAEGFKKLFQAFAEKHPDWQIKYRVLHSRTSAANMRACSSRPAPGARRTA